MERKNQPTPEPVIVVEENPVSRKFLWAPPRRTALDYDQARRDLLGRGWPERYLGGSWDAVDEETRTLAQDAIRKEFLTPGRLFPRGMLIHGKIGVGKSSLMGLAALYLVRTFPITIKFIHAGALFDEFFEDKSTSDYRNCHVLCLDDLGQEYRSEYAVSRFTRILEHRYSNLLTTFITTQRTADEIRRLPAFQHIGDRLNDPSWLMHFYYDGETRRVR